LLVTISSKNLNGDVDVFTAITYRPLIKTSLYASSQSGEVTKGFYLRAHQILILRVEARTPNDDPGTYQIRFGGSFAPFSGGIPVAENTEPQDDSSPTNRGSRRLSSVGAKLPEPAVETPPVNAEPKTETATEKPTEDTGAAKKTTPAKTAKTKPVRPSTTARNSRSRPPVKPKPKPPDTETASTTEKTEPAKAETEKKDTGTTEEAKTEAAKPDRPDKPEKPEAPKPSTQELPLPGAHLIIESKDGTKIDRPMSTVRRLVVEGGTIVILLKTGRIERIPMSTVARMAIEP